jgi:hypothetical protein
MREAESCSTVSRGSFDTHIIRFDGCGETNHSITDQAADVLMNRESDG